MKHLLKELHVLHVRLIIALHFAKARLSISLLEKPITLSSSKAAVRNKQTDKQKQNVICTS